MESPFICSDNIILRDIALCVFCSMLQTHDVSFLKTFQVADGGWLTLEVDEENLILKSKVRVGTACKEIPLDKLRILRARGLSQSYLNVRTGVPP